MLARSMALQEHYAELYRDYLERGIDKTLSKDDLENTFDADWKYQHYFNTGSDAIRLIVNGLVQGFTSHQKPFWIFRVGQAALRATLDRFSPKRKLLLPICTNSITNFVATFSAYRLSSLEKTSTRSTSAESST